MQTQKIRRRWDIWFPEFVNCCRKTLWRWLHHCERWDTFALWRVFFSWSNCYLVLSALKVLIRKKNVFFWMFRKSRFVIHSAAAVAMNQKTPILRFRTFSFFLFLTLHFHEFFFLFFVKRRRHLCPLTSFFHGRIISPVCVSEFSDM